LLHGYTAKLCCLGQGDKFLDSLDDIAVDSVVLLDGMHIWGPAKTAGLTALKLWVADWLQQYELNVAITASTATPTSNKVRSAECCVGALRPGLFGTSQANELSSICCC
jgi:hypothetical protein